MFGYFAYVWLMKCVWLWYISWVWSNEHAQNDKMKKKRCLIILKSNIIIYEELLCEVYKESKLAWRWTTDPTTKNIGIFIKV
jgi:hypothetical protein